MRGFLCLLLLAAACDEVGRTPRDAGFFTNGSSDAGFVSPPVDAGTNIIIQVQTVIDGDTVRLNASAGAVSPDGKPLNGETIRMLGVDAPEIAHPNDPTMPTTVPDCWGDESHRAARNLIQGLRVHLEYGSNDYRDIYGRLLAYIILPDGRVANEVMISNGDARAFRAFRHRDYDKYSQLEAVAKARGDKVWTCP